MSKEVQNISVDVLKVHPRNDEFFDDINGEEWERFKSSIRDDGVLSPIIVSPDMTIISGHQRAKAAKEVGLTLVPIIINGDLADEGVKLRALIAANFGRTKNNESKQRKAIAEYVELCGYKNGEMGRGREKLGQNDLPKLSQDNIAKTLGISVKSLKRAISIERNLTDDMKELLDTGVISKTLASDIIAGLTPEEQTELISNLDVTKRITQREVQEHINENRRLKQELESKPTESAKDMENEILRNENSNLKSEYQRVIDENKRLNDYNTEITEGELKEYRKLKSQLIHMGIAEDNIAYVYEADNAITELNGKLRELLSQELAPLKYEKYMYAVKNNALLKENLTKTISLLQEWCSDMMKNIGEIEVESRIIEEDVVDAREE